MSFEKEIEFLCSSLNLPPLLGIVTGMEHSGTTLLSQLLINRVKHVDSGFECGVLLAQSPKEFNKIQPFYDWFCLPAKIGHWGLTPQMRSWVCNTGSFMDFYDRLRIMFSLSQRKGVAQLIDKTPAYIYDLKNVLDKVSCPVVITYKSVELLYLSYKKREVTLPDFLIRYKKYKESVRPYLEDENILLLSFEAIVSNQEETLHSVFKHFRLEADIGEVSDALNFGINPLNPEFDLDEEYEKANSLLSDEEKEELAKLSEN